MSNVNSQVGLPPPRVVDGYAIAPDKDGGFCVDLYAGNNILDSLHGFRYPFPDEATAHAVAKRCGYRPL